MGWRAREEWEVVEQRRWGWGQWVSGTRLFTGTWVPRCILFYGTCFALSFVQVFPDVRRSAAKLLCALASQHTQILGFMIASKVAQSVVSRLR